MLTPDSDEERNGQHEGCIHISHAAKLASSDVAGNTSTEVTKSGIRASNIDTSEKKKEFHQNHMSGAVADATKSNTTKEPSVRKPLLSCGGVAENVARSTLVPCSERGSESTLVVMTGSTTEGVVSMVDTDPRRFRKLPSWMLRHR